MEEKGKAPVLILGIGNILLKDEGIGVHIIRALERLALPHTIELVDGGTAGADMIEVLADRQYVFVLDAVACTYSPGTVIKLKPGDLIAPGAVPLSLHEVNLLDTLGMLAQIRAAPGHVRIYGLVPADTSPGLDLTPGLAAIIPQVIELLLAEINSIEGELICMETDY